MIIGEDLGALAAMLTIAMALDALLGEPEGLWRRLPHPAVLMGRAVAALDRRLNHGRLRRAAGVLAVLTLVVGAAALGAALAAIPWIGDGLAVIGAAVLLAQRSLCDHVAAVAAGLRDGLTPGRRAVSMIVGRDPEALDEAGVARAAIESAAENFSDGVVAPAFWFLVAGLPGILIYKTVNTADSMIGHRSDRYRRFGWAAARLDDALNLIPARVTGALLCLVGAGATALRVMWRDARLHKSPNAGWPEAATAVSLDVALAGPRLYGGVLTDDPWVNPAGRRHATAQDIEAAVRLLWRGWAATVILLGLVAVSIG